MPTNVLRIVLKPQSVFFPAVTCAGSAKPNHTHQLVDGSRQAADMTDPAPSLTPALVLLFSGKRKSGKDFITDRLAARLGERSVILRLSGPLKGWQPNLG